MSGPIVATLIPRQSGGKNYYTYSVEFAGDLIVKRSTNPEHDACRALLARGVTGPLLLLDCATGKERSRIDIERGALWLVSEGQHGFRLTRWKPFPCQDSSGTGESLDPSAGTLEAA